MLAARATNRALQLLREVTVYIFTQTQRHVQEDLHTALFVTTQAARAVLLSAVSYAEQRDPAVHASMLDLFKKLVAAVKPLNDAVKLRNISQAPSSQKMTQLLAAATRQIHEARDRYITRTEKGTLLEHEAKLLGALEAQLDKIKTLSRAYLGEPPDDSLIATTIPHLLDSMERCHASVLELLPSVFERAHAVHLCQDLNAMAQLIAQVALTGILAGLRNTPHSTHPLLLGFLLRIWSRLVNSTLTSLYAGLHVPGPAII